MCSFVSRFRKLGVRIGGVRGLGFFSRVGLAEVRGCLDQVGAVGFMRGLTGVTVYGGWRLRG